MLELCNIKLDIYNLIIYKNMIGKPEWFGRRKYGGWGLNPRTWQGWVYIAVFLIPLIAFNAVPYWADSVRAGVTLVWTSILILDMMHIMVTLKSDEREYKIEAISERNAAWVMVAVLAVGIMYQLFTSANKELIEIDWFLPAALFGGLVAKALSNIFYSRKSL